MIPKMSVSPEATRARIMPLTRPLMVWMRICSRGMPTRSDSQELVDDGVVGAQVRRGCVVADHALLHDVDAVRGLAGERHVLLHEQGGHAPDLAPLEGDVPFGRAHEAHHRLERGALADAVATEQPHHLARADLDRHPVENVGLAVIGVDVVQDQHQVFRYTSWTRGFAWIWAGVPSASTSP